MSSYYYNDDDSTKKELEMTIQDLHKARWAADNTDMATIINAMLNKESKRKARVAKIAFNMKNERCIRRLNRVT